MRRRPAHHVARRSCSVALIVLAALLPSVLTGCGAGSGAVTQPTGAAAAGPSAGGGATSTGGPATSTPASAPSSTPSVTPSVTPRLLGLTELPPLPAVDYVELEQDERFADVVSGLGGVAGANVALRAANGAVGVVATVQLVRFPAPVRTAQLTVLGDFLDEYAGGARGTSTTDGSGTRWSYDGVREDGLSVRAGATGTDVVVVASPSAQVADRVLSDWQAATP